MMRRFWKSVALEPRDGALPLVFALPLSPLELTFSPCTGDYAVLLDKRTLKTPGGTQLLVPKERLPVALCIADEWENQTTVLKPHTLPMVRSTSSTS